MTTRGKINAGRPGFGGSRGVFMAPSHTQFPNAVLDEFMAELSGAEFKVLAYIARRTFGFHRQAAAISVKQLCGGLVMRDGRRLDCGTGLSRAAAFKAVAGLEGKGLVAVRRGGGKDSGRVSDTNTYTLWVEGVDGQPLMADEWVDTGAWGEGLKNGPSGSTNQTGEGLKNGPSYKEKKESGKESPLSPPVEKGKGKTQNQNQNPTPTKTPKVEWTAPCMSCNGFGLLQSGLAMAAPHNGTLAEARGLVEEWGARFCTCAVGKCWAVLIADAAKGDGLRKGQGQAVAGAVAGSGKGKGK